MSSDAKVIRGQVRQVVKEILGDVLKAELTEAIRKEIGIEAARRLDAISKQLHAKLEEIDQRSKDVSSFLVRQEAARSTVTPVSES